MPYAANDRISHEPIEGGIEITEQQYQIGLSGIQDGEHIQIIDGEFFVGPLPEPDVEPEPETEPDWSSLIADHRYAHEIAGVEVNGIPIATDDRSKLLINGAALEAMIDPNYVMQWKTPNGFVEMNAQMIIFIARAVRQHVQSCFDREAALLVESENGTITDEMLEQGWPNERLLHFMV